VFFSVIALIALFPTPPPKFFFAASYVRDLNYFSSYLRLNPDLFPLVFMWVKKVQAG
jgi:hypothetical protein